MIRIIMLLLGLLFFSPSVHAQAPVAPCVTSTSTVLGLNTSNCNPVTATNPLPVTSSASGPIVVTPEPVTSSPTAFAPTAGAFSSAIAASATRKGCLIQNVGTTLGYVYFGANGSATTSNSFQIAAGQWINCADNATIDQSNVSATCASGTCAFIVKSE